MGKGPESLADSGPFAGEYQNTPSTCFWCSPWRGRTGSPLTQPVLLARVMADRNRRPPFQGGADIPRGVVSPEVRTRPPPVTFQAPGPHHSGRRSPVSVLPPPAGVGRARSAPPSSEAVPGKGFLRPGFRAHLAVPSLESVFFTFVGEDGLWLARLKGPSP